jgi:hypothetical protein
LERLEFRDSTEWLYSRQAQKFSKFVLYKLYKMKLTKKAKIELDDIGFIGSQEKLSKAEQKKIDEATSSFIKVLKKKRARKQLFLKKIPV